MESSSQLEQLAADLYGSAQHIKAFCGQESYPNKSLDSIQPATLLPADAPDSIKIEKQNVRDTATRILQLTCDPTDFVGAFQVEYQQLASIHWLCHFKIISHVPLTESVTYEFVASAAAVPLTELKSIARMAITRNFLREPSSGRLGHSAISAAFIENVSLSDWAIFVATTSAGVASKIVEATEKFGTTDSKTETSYNIWRNTDKPFFDDLKESKERTAQFAGYMRNVTSGQGTKIEHLVSGYDWASLGSATVIDLGGSNGHASIALAATYPTLRFIVQDLAGTIETSKPDLSSLPASISERIDFQDHDFFNPQPLQDVDVFLLRMIIHDWPTTEATKILRNLVSSLKPGGRIIIMDTLLPQPGSGPTIVEAALRVRDMTMMQTHNSKEREFDEWVALLESADARLRLKSVRQPFGSTMAILEVERNDISV